MKLTKQEQKIIGIKRAIRSGAGFWVTKRMFVSNSKVCKHCKGDFRQETADTITTCKHCSRGRIYQQNTKKIVADRVTEEVDIAIPSWDDSPVMCYNHKLDEIYLTEKGAKARAKKMTAEARKKEEAK